MRPEDCDLAAGRTSADDFDAFMESIAGKIGDWMCANREQIAKEKISSIKIHKGHMSDETEIKEKNRELELERALKFWELKDEIERVAYQLYWAAPTPQIETMAVTLIDKLKSI